LNHKLTFTQGLRDGIPICLGYLSVSFAFGMNTAMGGLPVWMAVLISMTNVTSAGQVAGTALLLSSAPYFEIAMTTLIINLRYMLMSLSLSQKLDPSFSLGKRLIASFCVTDEIFAVASAKPSDLNFSYFLGLMTLPYFGWAGGTLLGAAATGLMPQVLRAALGVALYGMFIAIIIPPAREFRAVALVVLGAAVLSSIFYWVPLFDGLSSGWSVILCTLIISAAAALLFPIREEETDAEQEADDD